MKGIKKHRPEGFLDSLRDVFVYGLTVGTLLKSPPSTLELNGTQQADASSLAGFWMESQAWSLEMPLSKTVDPAWKGAAASPFSAGVFRQTTSVRAVAVATSGKGKQCPLLGMTL